MTVHRGIYSFLEYLTGFQAQITVLGDTEQFIFVVNRYRNEIYETAITFITVNFFFYFTFYLRARTISQGRSLCVYTRCTFQFHRSKKLTESPNRATKTDVVVLARRKGVETRSRVRETQSRIKGEFEVRFSRQDDSCLQIFGNS